MSKFDELYDKHVSEGVPAAVGAAAGIAATAAAGAVARHVASKAVSKLTEDDELKTFVVTTTTGDRWEHAEGVVVIVAKDENEARRLAKSRKSAWSSEYVENVIEVDASKPGIVHEQNPVVE